jgi:hypothetical protein
VRIELLLLLIIKGGGEQQRSIKGRWARIIRTRFREKRQISVKEVAEQHRAYETKQSAEGC